MMRGLSHRLYKGCSERVKQPVCLGHAGLSSQDPVNSNQVDAWWQWCINRMLFDSANDGEERGKQSKDDVAMQGPDAGRSGMVDEMPYRFREKRTGQVPTRSLKNVDYSNFVFGNRQFSSLAVREESVAVEGESKKSKSLVGDSEGHNSEGRQHDEHSTAAVMGKMMGNVRVENAMEVVRDNSVESIDKYLYLRREQRLHPAEFYKQLIMHCEDMLPYLYTPTVGEACQRYHRLPVPTYGVYIRTSDRGSMLEKLQSLPDEYQETKVVVVTDGERILGLGDLGAGGMGISEGKSLLYTAAAGVDPKEILPVCLDVGTGNQELLDDEEYFGLKEKRLEGEAYHAFVEEFICALQAWRPHVVLQFEDFANHMAFDLLQKYRNRLCCFNDDIQGTASITLAGLLAALRVTGKDLLEQRILFLGAGEAGTGIGELIAQGLSVWHSVPLEEGRKHCYFIDSKGLITRHRSNLQEHKMPFAHDIEPCSSLIESIKRVRPTVLVGVSTQPGAFTKEALELMAAINERPIIFALSNPTSKSECTYEDAFNATEGRVLFASGSPFPVLHAHGKTYHPAQSNNAYIFPAVGHAAVLCQSSKITDQAFLIAADALARMATEEELACGRLFPRFSRIRSVSCQLMGVVAHHMVETGVGRKPDDFDAVTSNVLGDVQKWEAYAAKHMYQPVAAVGLPRL